MQYAQRENAINPNVKLEASLSFNNTISPIKANTNASVMMSLDFTCRESRVADANMPYNTGINKGLVYKRNGRRLLSIKKQSAHKTSQKKIVSLLSSLFIYPLSIYVRVKFLPVFENSFVKNLS